MTDVCDVLALQRAYFESGATLPVSFRCAMLERLYKAIKANEKKIAGALYEDLGKADYESYMCEIGLALSEISYMRKNVKRWAKPQKRKTPLSHFRAKSYTLSVPYGNTLIMSPWNYPFLLTVSPLANAIAAGNTAIVKPSAYAPATSAMLARLLSECFAPEYVAVVTGGRRENAALLDLKFDFIFFTGSASVGREVLRRAAEHLTPTVLELGGKSPVIVCRDADVPLAARRILFGKILNCGQTCVAPDYVLCEESVRDQLLACMEKELYRQLGDVPLDNPDYGKMVNEKHFDRVLSLIDREKVVLGGEYDRARLKIAPTVMKDVCESDAVMGEEIFGPVLPVLTFRDISEVYAMLASKEKPLALYLFTKDKRLIKELTTKIRYGGGCVNDVIVHLATSEMPFGGVGESGMGAYHGKRGFDAFSHEKSILHKKAFDLPMRYHPYQSRYARLLRFFLK